MKNYQHHKFTHIYLDEIDSTNSYLKKLLFTSKIKEFTLVTTYNQKAGKGQRGNFWESEAGKNLTFSFNIKPLTLPINKQFLISKVVSLAMQMSISEYIDSDRVFIKWPNDIYIDNKKVAGILIENILLDEHIEHCIIGIGVNINQTIFLSNAPNPTSVFLSTGQQVNKAGFMNSFLKHFIDLYSLLNNNKWEDINQAYHKYLYRFRSPSLYADSTGIFTGVILSVNEEGVINILNTDKQQDNRYLFKEVKYII